MNARQIKRAWEEFLHVNYEEILNAVRTLSADITSLYEQVKR